MAAKGGGKGKAPVNCNVAGMPNSTIDGLPNTGVAIFRESADLAVEFCEKVREAIFAYPVGQVHFDNIDVSSVAWPLVSFSLLLDVLQEKAASTKRLKAFKSGLDDECINCMADWLETLEPEQLPSEIHLSHNRVTQRGFERLIECLETKRSQLTRKAVPVWLRLENNQVDHTPTGPIMKPLVDAGRAVFATRISDRVPSAAAICMPDFKGLPPLARQTGQQVQQVVQPARLALPSSNMAGGAGGKGHAAAAAPGVGTWWNAAGQPWAAGCMWQQAMAQAQAAQHQPTVVYPPAWQAALQQGRGGLAASGGRADHAGAAVDRSRTPAARQKAESKVKLPPDWEEQWSDEYQIPYFWNRVTGESLWEPPEE